MRRSTWVLLLIFGLLVVFTWLFQRYQANKAEPSPTATPLPHAMNVYDLTNLQVNEMNISDNEGNKIDLFRDATTSDKWAIKDIPPESADSVGIQTAISQLLSIRVIDQLTENPPLDSIGLAKPVYTITMQTTDGQQVVTDVGILTPIQTGYYVRVGNGPVMIVDNLTLDTILNYLKKPPLLSTPTPAATPVGTSIAPDLLLTPTP